MLAKVGSYSYITKKCALTPRGYTISKHIRIRINCCQLTCSYYTYILLYTSLYTRSFKGGAAIFVCQAFGRSGVATRDGFQLAAMLQHLLVLAVSYGR